MHIAQISFKYVKERIKCIYIVISTDIQKMIPPTRISVHVFNNFFVIPFSKVVEIY